MQKSRRWIAPLLIGGVIVCVLSIPLGAKVMLNMVFPTAVPPTYTANESARNCLLLPNADQQPFCRDLTGGDAVTFNQALKQSFPVGKATYVEIMKYFGHLQTEWYADLNGMKKMRNVLGSVRVQNHR
jgi:hypothetical protein